MSTKIINPTQEDKGSFETCEAIGCVGLHLMGQCFSFSETEAFRVLAHQVKKKALHTTIPKRIRDDTKSLCRALENLRAMVKNPNTTIIALRTEMTKMINKFGGNNPAQRELFRQACIDVLYSTRPSLKPLRRHKVPDHDSGEQILVLLANYPFNKWVQHNLMSLVRKAEQLYKVGIGLTGQALGIGDQLQEEITKGGMAPVIN